ncbi:MAG: hypothetical protein O7C63_08550, partial [Alphaproteobacteria bacterium]|nr:hypothetical protein [Alphaproteobacteria bacterium]
AGADAEGGADATDDVAASDEDEEGPTLQPSLALAELERTTGYTWDNEVSVLLGGGSASNTVRVIRGTTESSVDLPGR